MFFAFHKSNFPYIHLEQEAKEMCTVLLYQNPNKHPN